MSEVEMVGGKVQVKHALEYYLEAVGLGWQDEEEGLDGDSVVREMLFFIDQTMYILPRSYSHWHTTTTMSHRNPYDLRAKYTHFRILVIGRANAGKTTLLKRVCNTTEDPCIYDKDKNLVSCS
jgi:predicted GTPase